MGRVDYQREGATTIITLNRPEKLNALDVEMARGLAQAWIDFQGDTDATVAILTGTVAVVYRFTAGRISVTGRAPAEDS